MAAPIAPELRAEIQKEGPKLATVLGIRGAARKFGVSQTTFRRFLYPAEAERQRILSRDAKRRRRGICVDCGCETRYGGKANGGVSLRCPACAAEAARFWTREKIIEAIQRWARIYGKPPAAKQWLRSQRDGECPHPPMSAVYKTKSHPGGPFDSWADAIEAAGFPRPRTGYYERTPEVIARQREARWGRRD